MDGFVSTGNLISQNSLQWLLHSWSHISWGDEEAHAAQSPAGEQGVHHSRHFLATETIRAQNPVSGPCFGPTAGNIEEARRWCDSRDKQKKRRSHSKQWLDQRPSISMIHFIVNYMRVRGKETHSVSKIKTKVNQ